jgi:hypothetical protein
MKNLITTLLFLIALTLTAATDPQSIRIPAEVTQQIKSAAAEKWGTDYRMQAYTIEKQSNAYKELYAWATDNRNNSTFTDIFRAAEKKWPGDYRMQLYTVEKQIEAFNKINN